MGTADMQDVLHKTLVIRLSSVGDVVLTSPLLRSLRGRFPACQIDFLVKSDYADLVRHNPHVARVIEFPGNGSPVDLYRLRREILSSGYDLIIDVHDSLRSRFLCAGATRVVRINKRKIARALLVRFKKDEYAHWGGAPAVIDRYIEPLYPYGVTNDGKGLELFVPAGIVTTVASILAGEGVYPEDRCIGVCPSARHANKVWPAERYAAAAGELAARHSAPVLLFGSAEEREKCEEIAKAIHLAHPGVRVANLAGWTSLLETAAAMDRCAVVLTNDTGLMHIASARGAAVVAVFGPTVRQFGFFPDAAHSTVLEAEGLACRPCTHIGLPDCPKGHFLCMREITTEEMVAAATVRMGGPAPQ
jgi:lipopolysaccharide heptosyltransferase II